MGHLLRMCNTLQQCLSKNGKTKAALQSSGTLTQWEAFVNTSLQLENTVTNIILGGHRPSSPMQNQEAEEYNTMANLDPTGYLSSSTGHPQKPEEDPNYPAAFQEFDQENDDEQHIEPNYHQGGYDENEDEDDQKWNDAASDFSGQGVSASGMLNTPPNTNNHDSSNSATTAHSIPPVQEMGGMVPTHDLHVQDVNNSGDDDFNPRGDDHASASSSSSSSSSSSQSTSTTSSTTTTTASSTTSTSSTSTTPNDSNWSASF